MNVTFNDPLLPKGTEVDVKSLLFINGESVEITDEQVAVYERETGKNFFDLVNGKKFSTLLTNTQPHTDTQLEMEAADDEDGEK